MSHGLVQGDDATNALVNVLSSVATSGAMHGIGANKISTGSAFGDSLMGQGVGTLSSSIGNSLKYSLGTMSHAQLDAHRAVDMGALGGMLGSAAWAEVQAAMTQAGSQALWDKAKAAHQSNDADQQRRAANIIRALGYRDEEKYKAAMERMDFEIELEKSMGTTNATNLLSNIRRANKQGFGGWNDDYAFIKKLEEKLGRSVNLGDILKEAQTRGLKVDFGSDEFKKASGALQFEEYMRVNDLVLRDGKLVKRAAQPAAVNSGATTEVPEGATVVDASTEKDWNYPLPGDGKAGDYPEYVKAGGKYYKMNEEGWVRTDQGYYHVSDGIPDSGKNAQLNARDEGWWDNIGIGIEWNRREGGDSWWAMPAQLAYDMADTFVAQPLGMVGTWLGFDTGKAYMDAQHQRFSTRGGGMMAAATGVYGFAKHGMNMLLPGITRSTAVGSRFAAANNMGRMAQAGVTAQHYARTAYRGIKSGLGNLASGIGNMARRAFSSTDDLARAKMASNAGMGTQIPLTGNAHFDQLAIKTPQFRNWLARVQSKDYTVQLQRLRTGEHATIEQINGKLVMKIDPRQYTYLDLLHESRHVAQVNRAREAGLNPFTKNAVGILEKGAYKYEMRLGERFGFSDEYMQFANRRLNDYFTSKVLKSIRYDPKMKELMEVIGDLGY